MVSHRLPDHFVLVRGHQKSLRIRHFGPRSPSGDRPPPPDPLPSSDIVPVTATFVLPVSSPGVSTSSTLSVKAKPADGPPTVP